MLPHIHAVVVIGIVSFTNPFSFMRFSTSNLPKNIAFDAFQAFGDALMICRIFTSGLIASGEGRLMAMGYFLRLKFSALFCGAFTNEKGMTNFQKTNGRKK